MILEYEGYRVEEASTGARGAGAGRRPPAGTPMFLDIKMPEMDGLEVLRALRERGYDMPVVVISGHGDIATAVEATRRGAFDFFEKPLQRERVLLSLRNAVETDRLQRENRRLRPRARASSIGDSRGDAPSCARRSSAPRRPPPPC